MSSKVSVFVHPWYRIAFFIVAVLIFWTASFYFETDFFGIDVWYMILWPFFLILISGFIEFRRPGNHFWIFGLDFDRTSSQNILLGAISVLLFVLFYLFAAFLFFEISLGNIGSFTLNLLLFQLAVAFSEEILLRGIILQSLADKIGFVGAASITSVTFSALHLFNPSIDILSLVNITIAGLLFSFMYFKTRSLWLPISFHYFWNVSVSLILGANVSGLSYEYPILIVSGVPQNIFWGGYFGPESGLLATIFLIMMFFGTNKLGKLSPYVTSKMFKRRYSESQLKNDGF